MSTKGTYTAIQDWMLDLGLDVWETIAFAVIFGFSQDGESTFTGSLAYLSRKMMCSRAKTINALKHLVEIGLVQKISIVRNGVKFCEYRAYLPDTGSISQQPGSIYQIPGGGIPEQPNNIVLENIDKNKEKRNNNIAHFTPPTQSEVEAYCRERGNSVDAQHFVDYYSANGWRVGKNPMKDWRAAVRTWEANRKTTATRNAPNTSPFPRRQESVYEKNARAFAEFQQRLQNQFPDEQ